MGEVARRLGKPFMPWQQLVADVLMEIDPDTGRLAYSEFGLTVPRQSGKSTFILAKVVHRGSATKFFGGRQRMVYTAQTRKDARKKWEDDYAPDIEASPYFGSRVKPHWGNGNENMRFPNGSKFALESTTEKAGHGGVLDEAYIDEAFAQQDSRTQQAFEPAMITRANTLLAWVSTAGWLNGSPFLEAKVVRGRQNAEMGIRTGLAYFEWSAPEDADPADRDVWRACMPALGHTISEQSIANRLQAAMDEGKVNEFRRAYLNQWVPKTSEDIRPALPADGWAACLDPKSTADRAGAIGVDVTPDRSTVNIAVAGGRRDGLAHVELADQVRGVARALDLLVGMAKRHNAPVVVDKQGHASALVVDLERAGVKVLILGAQEVAKACTRFYDATAQGHLRHIGQAQVDAAVSGATTKELAGGFKWMPHSDVSISPLYAETLALYGYAQGAADSVYEDRGLVIL